MIDELKQRLAALDPVLETHYDTQRSVEQDPHGATQAIEQALYLLRDQAGYIEELEKISNGFSNLWAEEATAKQVAFGRIEELKAKLAKAVEALRLADKVNLMPPIVAKTIHAVLYELEGMK